MITKRLLALQLVVCTICAPITAHAQVNQGALTLSKELQINTKGNEFVSGDYPGAVLMKVNLWGATQKAGIHYVPVKTDLVTLLSYAGGPTERATLDEVTIKRVVNGKEQVIDVNLDKILSGTKEKSPQLEANDIVVIPSKQPVLSQDTLTMMGFIGGLLSIAVSGYFISEIARGKK